MGIAPVWGLFAYQVTVALVVRLIWGMGSYRQTSGKMGKTNWGRGMMPMATGVASEMHPFTVCCTQTVSVSGCVLLNQSLAFNTLPEKNGVPPTGNWVNQFTAAPATTFSTLRSGKLLPAQINTSFADKTGASKKPVAVMVAVPCAVPLGQRASATCVSW